MPLIAPANCWGLGLAKTRNRVVGNVPHDRSVVAQAIAELQGPAADDRAAAIGVRGSKRHQSVAGLRQRGAALTQGTPMAPLCTLYEVAVNAPPAGMLATLPLASVMARGRAVTGKV